MVIVLFITLPISTNTHVSDGQETSYHYSHEYNDDGYIDAATAMFLLLLWCLWLVIEDVIEATPGSLVERGILEAVLGEGPEDLVR